MKWALAGQLRLAEVVGEDAVDDSVTQLVEQLFQLRVAAQRPGADEHQEGAAVGFDQVEPGGGVGGDHLLDRQVEVGAHGARQSLGRRRDDGEEEAALVAEVVVDEGTAGARVAGDRVDVDLVVGLLREGSRGGAQDLLFAVTGTEAASQF